MTEEFGQLGKVRIPLEENSMGIGCYSSISVLKGALTRSRTSEGSEPESDEGDLYSGMSAFR